jgi:hypothetical protein
VQPSLAQSKICHRSEQIAQIIEIKAVIMVRLNPQISISKNESRLY